MALYDILKDLRLTYKCLKRIAAQRDNTYYANWLHNMTSNYCLLYMADQTLLLAPYYMNKMII
jgi:hypothetical protein